MTWSDDISGKKKVAILVSANVVLILLVEALFFLLMLLLVSIGKMGHPALISTLHPIFTGPLTHTSAEETINSWRFDPVLGWRHIPDSYMETRGASFYIDKNGFNSNRSKPVESDIHFHSPRPGNEKLIFLIGGSTAFGVGSSANEKTIAAQLEKQLNANEEMFKYRIINAGIGGYNSIQEMLFLSTELIKYDPDMVIVFDGTNDLKLIGYNEPPLKFGHQFPLHYNYTKEIVYTVEHIMGQDFKTFDAIRRDLVNYMYTFYFLDRLMTKLGRARMTAEIQSGNFSKYDFKTFQLKSVDNLLREYRYNLLSMIGVAKSNNIKIALFLQPILGIGEKPLGPKEKDILERFAEREPHRKDWHKKVKEAGLYDEAGRLFYDIKKEHDDGKNVSVENIMDAFDNMETDIYIDSMHYNDYGNEILADRMKASVLKLLKLLKSG